MAGGDIEARPRIVAVDHVSWTVPDLEEALSFYRDVLGGEELFRMGPLDAADLPSDASGRDWMETHVGVAGARLSLVMLKLADNLNLQLVQYDKPGNRRQDLPRNCDRGGHHLALKVDDVEKAGAWLAQHGCKTLEVIAIEEGPLAGKKNLYVLDPFGHQLELVD
ncbi:VOC family protein [Sphingosinicella sp. CPCC 101087]|uniref:VOC family protein n=1 Tax=Sphingosinicella sp. CPCC 101087 TaxID=2497754 RepID=UPI00101B878F|nr:VOC family protein [Sphingosinicella sp. CPCC 101087]